MMWGKKISRKGAKKAKPQSIFCDARIETLRLFKE